MTPAGAGSDKVPNVNMHKDCRVFNDITETGQMDVAVAYTDRINTPAALERTISRQQKRSGLSMYIVYTLHVFGILVQNIPYEVNILIFQFQNSTYM